MNSRPSIGHEADAGAGTQPGSQAPGFLVCRQPNIYDPQGRSLAKAAFLLFSVARNRFLAVPARRVSFLMRSIRITNQTQVVARSAAMQSSSNPDV
jgi:hypothetical protein